MGKSGLFGVIFCSVFRYIVFVQHSIFPHDYAMHSEKKAFLVDTQKEKEREKEDGSIKLLSLT